MKKFFITLTLSVISFSAFEAHSANYATICGVTMPAQNVTRSVPGVSVSAVLLLTSATPGFIKSTVCQFENSAIDVRGNTVAVVSTYSDLGTHAIIVGP